MNHPRRAVTFRRHCCGTGARFLPRRSSGKEIRQMLQDAIANLSPLYREVLILRDVEEFSIEETATALTITAGDCESSVCIARA